MEILWGANTTAAQSSFTQMDSKVSGSSKGFGKWSSGVKASVAAAGGYIALSVGRDMVDSFSEANRVAAQSETVIKSTGGAAGLTAQDFADLATARSKLTGIDDEAIQAEENWLATFTKVQNAQGQGNDIFNQASVAIQDMATSMNQGAVPAAEQLQSATTLVGKALNDPIKGLTALTRVGVNFTDKQKEQITTLVDTGHAMDAQKIILAELNKEFGGSSTADTFDRRMAKVGVTLDGVKEIGGQVIASFLEPLGTALQIAAPLLELVAKNAGLLLAEFVAFKVVRSLPDLLLKVSSAIAGLGSGTAANSVLKVGEGIAAMSAPEIIGGLALLTAGLADLGFAIGAFINDPMSKTKSAVDEASGSTEEWTRITNEAASAGRFAGAKTQYLGEQYLKTSGSARELTAAQSAARTEMQHTTAGQESLTAAENAGMTAAEQAASAQARLTSELKDQADAARNLYAAQLSLAGGFLGLEGASLSYIQSARDLKDAQQEVNKLQEKGKKGTEEYKDAVLNMRQAEVGAIASKLSLVQKVQEYVKENAGSNASTQEAIGLIRQYGQNADMTGGQIHRLVGDVLDLIDKNGQVPPKVETHYLALGLAGNLTALSKYNQYIAGLDGKQVYITVHTAYVDTGSRPHGGIQAASGFSGWVDRPTPMLVGEGGEREYVSVTPQSRMGGAGLGRDGGLGVSPRQLKNALVEAFEEIIRRHPGRVLVKPRDL